MSIEPPKLTRKQAKFVEGIAQGKSGTQAALEAYDTTDVKTASVIATENLAKPSVKEALAPILAKHDISLDTAIAPIGRALKDEDVKTQLQGSDRALKLMGVGNQDSGNTYNFTQIVHEQQNKYGI